MNTLVTPGDPSAPVPHIMIVDVRPSVCHTDKTIILIKDQRGIVDIIYSNKPYHHAQ